MRGLGRLVNGLLRPLGLERRRRQAAGESSRASLGGALDHAKAMGWEPATCVDVGAAFGRFSLACARVFPRAHYLLVEPLEEYRPYLEAVGDQLAHASYAGVAAAARSGETSFHIHADLVGSSMLREAEGPKVDGASRIVTAVTLDEFTRARGAGGPYLLKVDVQGAELEVLRGARSVLAATDYVILETSFFRFFIEGPELPAVIEFMSRGGFVPYDIFGLQYRPLDGALSQVDLVFVREDGLFRRHHVYATPEQRAAQDRRFAESLARKRADLDQGPGGRP